MDIDLHAFSILDLSDNHHDPAEEENSNTDDDSFGEASDDCMPNEEYMEQLLEDYHPERLNLLDPIVPESFYNKKAQSSSSEFSKANPETTTQSDQGTKGDSKTKTLDSHNDEEKDEKCLHDDRGNVEQRPQLQRTKMLNGIGQSTNKLSRAINGGDFAEQSEGPTKNIRNPITKQVE